MAASNTLGATALSSYGRFWISLAMILTPGGFNIQGSYTNPVHFNYALGFFLMVLNTLRIYIYYCLLYPQGWFIFTLLLWLVTFKSTVVFCLLFLWVWLTYLMLSLSYLLTPDISGGAQNVHFQKAGGMFGLLAAFFAWYVALAGLADDSNRYAKPFMIPLRC